MRKLVILHKGGLYPEIYGLAFAGSEEKIF